MQHNVRYGLAATVALIVGMTGAAGYARLAIPYYEAVITGITQFYPWRLLDLSLHRDSASPAAALRMTGEVRRTREDVMPAARVVVDVQVGEVVETPIVFWAVVGAWPMATWRRRWVGVALGIPVFLLLEAITTGCQLVHSMAEVSAMLAGEVDPLTGWERWSRFLEAGGRFAVELCGALVTVGIATAVTSPDAQSRARRRTTLLSAP